MSMTDAEIDHSRMVGRERAPGPDGPSKPDSPDDLTNASWRFVLRKTLREFSDDECMDVAAGLTYYAVLSVFPALLVMVSLLGVLGEGRRTTDALLGAVADLAPGGVVDLLRQPIDQVVE